MIFFNAVLSAVKSIVQLYIPTYKVVRVIAAVVRVFIFIFIFPFPVPHGLRCYPNDGICVGPWTQMDTNTKYEDTRRWQEQATR